MCPRHGLERVWKASESRRCCPQCLREKKARQNRRNRAAHRERYLARKAVENAVRSGRLTKPEGCVRCGLASRLEGHHWSYETRERLSVLWLCYGCHQELEALLTGAGSPFRATMRFLLREAGSGQPREERAPEGGPTGK